MGKNTKKLRVIKKVIAYVIIFFLLISFLGCTADENRKYEEEVVLIEEVKYTPPSQMFIIDSFSKYRSVFENISSVNDPPAFTYIQQDDGNVVIKSWKEDGTEIDTLSQFDDFILDIEFLFDDLGINLIYFEHETIGFEYGSGGYFTGMIRMLDTTPVEVSYEEFEEIDENWFYYYTHMIE